MGELCSGKQLKGLRELKDWLILQQWPERASICTEPGTHRHHLALACCRPLLLPFPCSLEGFSTFSSLSSPSQPQLKHCGDPARRRAPSGSGRELHPRKCPGSRARRLQSCSQGVSLGGQHPAWGTIATAPPAAPAGAGNFSPKGARRGIVSYFNQGIAKRQWEPLRPASS